MTSRTNQNPQLLDEFNLRKKLGKGAYATVYLAQDRKGQLFALKLIDKKKIEVEDKNMNSYIHEEICCMKKVRSHNTVQLFDVREDEDYHYLILEYCEKGDLASFQATLPSKVFTLEMATSFLSQVIFGLQVLHKQGYVHRDLKPQNVLIKNFNDQKILKIADFGFARKINGENQSSHVLGTERYISPEVYLDAMEDNPEKERNYGSSVDMWSFGVLFFFMLNQSFPFEINPFWGPQRKYKELVKQSKDFSYEKVVRRSRKKLTENCTPQLQDLFRQIFESDEDSRITFFEIRKHSVFSKHFPETCPFSIQLYSRANMSQLREKKKKKCSEISFKDPIKTSSISFSIISVPDEQEEQNYSREFEILRLEIQEIDFLWNMMEQFSEINHFIGFSQTLMLTFSLTKYYTLLLMKFISTLNDKYYSQKYAEKKLNWKSLFQSDKFKDKRQEYKIKLSKAQSTLDNLITKCSYKMDEINNLNQNFKQYIFPVATLSDQTQEFMQVYQKVLNLTYKRIKQQLKNNKINELYFYLCAVCICHVFEYLHKSSNMKGKVFGLYLSQEKEKTQIFSFQRYVCYLKNCSKEDVILQAKKVIDSLMIV